MKPNIKLIYFVTVNDNTYASMKFDFNVRKTSGGENGDSKMQILTNLHAKSYTSPTQRNVVS